MKEYIQHLASALKSPGARGFYFPLNARARRSANLRLAREFGAGLVDFSIETVMAEIGSSYGVLIVQHSLDSTGVQVDAKEFIQTALSSRLLWIERLEKTKLVLDNFSVS